MTKRELIDLLEARTDIPDDAEVRVTEGEINAPAKGVEYTVLGPLKYVEVV